MASGRVILLCSILILATFISSTQSVSCCVRYKKRLPKCEKLLGYTIQTVKMSCNIKAVIFHLEDRFVCANPEASSTKNLMQSFDERKRMLLQVFKEDNQNSTASA